MEPGSESLAQALFDFRAQYLADEAGGKVPQLEAYLKRFPRFEAEIRAAFLELEQGGLDPAHADSEPGEARRVAHYRILRLLGRGGQGSVYLAEDERLGRLVALKLLAGFSALSPRARRRFQREAELASRLDHPNLCTVYECGVDGERAYLALRFVEGETLAARIARARETGARGAAVLPAAPRERAELERCLEAFEATARALHAAHELGIVHRDLKPGNLMITDQGEPVLLDFGLARELESHEGALTLSGDILGTPAYMSPEQVDPRGRVLDARSDVYSLAATLHECLTLQRPFPAPTVDRLYQAILLEPAPDARRANRSVPRDLALVLQTALEKDRERRYVSAHEFAQDLRRVRLREAIQARPPGPWLRTVRWVQRNPVGAVAGALLALFGAAVLFGVLMRERASALQSAQSDRDFAERLLDQLADTPRRGPHFDWVQSSEHVLDEFARRELPLDGTRTPVQLAQGLARIEARAPELFAGVCDALYRFAATLEDVELGPKYAAADVPAELAPAALRDPRWVRVRSTVLELLERCERDAWRRAAWTAFRGTLATHQDALEPILRDPELERRPALDLTLLAELVYVARRDGSALRLYELAERDPQASPATRYVLRVSRGLLRARDPHATDTAAAVLDLTVACELRPGSAPTWVGLASALLAARAPDALPRALNCARRAVEADAQSSAAQTLLALLALRSGCLDESEAAARRAFELDSRDPNPLLLRAEARVAAQDLPAAWQCWRDAVRVTGRHSATSKELVWAEAGRCLARARTRAATLLECVDEELADDDSRALVLCAYGEESQRAGASGPAIEALERARELAPGNAPCRLALAGSLEADCEPEGALRVLREAARIAPDPRRVRVALAECLAARGEAAQACAVLEPVADEGLYDADFALLSAHCWQEAGFPSRGFACAQRALHDAPEDRRALALFVAAAQRAGDAQAELDARLLELERGPEPRREAGIQRVLELVARGSVELRAVAQSVSELRAREPSSVSLSVLDALLSFQNGAPARAESLLEAAVELDLRRALALSYLGDLCLSRGQLERAERLLAAALAREPGCLRALELAARCASERGEVDIALARALQAIEAGSQDPNTWNVALESARLSGRYDALVRAGRRALESADAPDAACEALVNCLGDLGRFDEAVLLLEARVQAHPARADLRARLGSILLDAGRARESVAVLEPLLAQPRGSRPEAVVHWALQLHATALARCAPRAAEPDPHSADTPERIRSCYRAGEFVAAADALFPGRAWHAFASLDEEHSAACIAACAARQAGKPAPVVAGAGAGDAGEAGPAHAPGAQADVFARLALDCLEHELTEVRERARREPDPGRRRALRARIEVQLAESNLVLLRHPPGGAPWAARAEQHFRSLRECALALRREGW